MASSTASLWWIANTGPSRAPTCCASVTTTAISMMRSVSGDRPVISQVDPDQVPAIAARPGWRRSVHAVAARGPGGRFWWAGIAAHAESVRAHVAHPPPPGLRRWPLVAYVEAWLVTRQMRAMSRHRGLVPAAVCATVGVDRTSARRPTTPWPRAASVCFTTLLLSPQCCWLDAAGRPDALNGGARGASVRRPLGRPWPTSWRCCGVRLIGGRSNCRWTFTPPSASSSAGFSRMTPACSSPIDLATTLVVGAVIGRAACADPVDHGRAGPGWWWWAWWPGWASTC